LYVTTVINKNIIIIWYIFLYIRAVKQLFFFYQINDMICQLIKLMAHQLWLCEKRKASIRHYKK